MITSGTYSSSDVTFLLKEVSISSTGIAEKERKIQTGTAHYSEMLTIEKAPDQQYQAIFEKALKANAGIFKGHLLKLVNKIYSDYSNQAEIVVVSLARAGTPCGVLVTRLLRQTFDKPVTHYCVSIIRDKGLDHNAMRHILTKHKDSEIVFIDGWTGKGAIGKELSKSIEVFNTLNKTSVSSNLYVIADISGTAYYGATYKDYLIPSAVLNATVSGLISRTVLNDLIGEEDYHGAMFYRELIPFDKSVYFVDYILSVIPEFEDEDPVIRASLIDISSKTITDYVLKYNLSSPNLVKPGIGESTRVLLRRAPHCLIVKNKKDEKVSHLLHLALLKDVPVIEDDSLSYAAIAIIRKEE